MADSQAANLAAARAHQAAYFHYLARAVRGSPPPPPPRRAPLPAPRYYYGDYHYGGGFEDGDVGAGIYYDHDGGYYHHRHGLDFDIEYDAGDLELGVGLHEEQAGRRRRQSRGHIDFAATDDDEDEDEDGDADDGADPAGGDDADADDDFAFALVDLVDLAYAVVSCVPPYPVYRLLPAYRDAHALGWAGLLFGYSLIFTFVITLFSVRVFRSSRRLVPTALRALVLGLSIGAQAAAAAHLLPSSTPATLLLTYMSVFIHAAIYIFAWCACCRRR